MSTKDVEIKTVETKTVESTKPDNKFPVWLEVSAFILLLLNIPLIILESFPMVRGDFPVHAIEWIFTGLFTVEYILRVFLAQSKRKYVFGWSGFIDFFATIPQYLLILFPLASELFLLRLLRLVRLLARGFKIVSSGKAFLREMLSVKKHFASHEKTVIEIGMSRLHYFSAYFIAVLIIILSATGALTINGPKFFGIPIIPSLLYMIFIGAFVFLGRNELHILTQRYAVTTHRILCSTKLLEEDVTSISMVHITDVSLHQNLIERILNVGSLQVHSSGDITSIILVGVRNPLHIKQLIHSNMMQLSSTQKH